MIKQVLLQLLKNRFTVNLFKVKRIDAIQKLLLLLLNYLIFAGRTRLRDFVSPEIGWQVILQVPWMKHRFLVKSQALLMTIAEVIIFRGDESLFCLNLSIENLSLSLLLRVLLCIHVNLLIYQVLQVVQ